MGLSREKPRRLATDLKLFFHCVNDSVYEARRDRFHRADELNLDYEIAFDPPIALKALLQPSLRRRVQNFASKRRPTGEHDSRIGFSDPDLTPSPVFAAMKHSVVASLHSRAGALAKYSP